MMARSSVRPAWAFVVLLFSSLLPQAPAATLNWINPAGGNSAVAANWSPAKVPAAGDTLVVDAAGTYTVTFNQSVSVAGLSVTGNGGTPTVRVPSGITLTLTGTGTVASNAVVALDSGVIAGSGELVCDGSFNWTGGNLTGNGLLNISPLGTLRITGTQPHYLINRRLLNRGTTLHDGSNHLFVRSAVGTPGVFENVGSYELAGALLIQSDLGGGSFLNTGIVRRTAAGTVGGISISMVNSGLIDVQQGRLNLGGGLANTGSIQVAANAELDLANGNVSLDPGTTITGTGRWLMDATVDINVALNVETPIRITAGTVKMNASLTTTAAFEQTGGNLILKNGLSQVLPNYDLTAGQLSGDGSTLTVTGTMTWSGGNLQGVDGTGRVVIPVGATLKITGAQPHYLINRRIVNQGSTVHDGANHLFVRSSGNGDGVFENVGTYRLDSALLIQSDLGGGEFINTGTFTRTASGVVGGISIHVQNSGILKAEQGRLNLAGGMANSGALNVAGAAELDFANGSFVLGPGTSLTGNGKWLLDATVEVNVPLTIACPIRLSAGTFTLNAPLTTSGEFEQVGGNFTLKSGLSQSLAVYKLSAGQLLGDGSTLTVTDTLTWSGGNLAGTDGSGEVVIPNNATLKITGTQPHYLINRRLLNRGTTVHDGANHLFVRSNGPSLGVFENRGTYELAAALLIQSDLGGGRFYNFGTFRRTAAGVVGGISIPAENNGVIDVQKGRLNLAGGMTNIGHLNVESGAELDFAGGNFLLTTGTTLTGTGRWLLDAIVDLTAPLDVATPILVTAGTFRVKAPLTTTAIFEQTAGAVELASGLTLALPDYRLSGGAFQGDNSTLRIDGKMTWNGGNLSGVNGTGTVLIPAASTLRITGTQPHYLINRRLVIEGSAVHDGANHVFVRSSASGQGVIENRGTYDLAAALLVQSDLGGGRFVNTGTLRRSATGVVGGISIAVENSGAIEAIQGRFNFAGGLSNTGPIQVGAAGELDFANGDFTLDAGTVVEGTGRWLIDANVSLNVPLTLETPILLSAGNLRVNKAFTTTAAFEQTGGNLVLGSAVEQALTSYKLSAGQVLGDGSTLAIGGAMNWSGGNLAGTDGTGRVVILPGSSLKITGTQPHYLISRRLVNQGTVVHDGANHVFVRSSASGAGVIENLGSYELAAQLLVQSDLGGGTFLNGGLFKRTATGAIGGITLTTTNSGNIELKTGTTTFANLVQTAGAFRLLGGDAKITQFDINGGTVSGTGKIDGPVRNNAGTVAPGSSPGFLQFASFSNGTNGTINLELGAGVGGTDFDQVRVVGAATLAGTLALTFLPDYTPNLSDTFTVVTAGTRTGQFGSLINPAGAQLEATYLPSSVVLNPTNIDVALPSIIRQPLPRTIVVGNPVQFDVAVEGSKPFTFQWQKNTANLGGETNPVLSFDAVKAADAANYRIVVSNKFGGATSLNAALKVVAAAAVPLNLGDTGNTEELLGVGFLNTDVGAVVGRKGTVLFTLNGGLTWTRSNTGVENDIYAVFFVEGATFIAGANGLLCVSYDLGASWKVFDSGTTADFRALYFTGPSLGFAVGTGGTLCRYNGTKWEVTPSGTNADFLGVHGRGGVFWAVGTGGTICVYRNGVWSPQNSGVTEPAFADVAFQTDTFGVVVGSGGTVCITRNAGSTWTPVASGTERHLRGVSFATSTILFITGDHGALLQSTDGGASFAIGGGGGTAGFRGLSYRDGTGYFADSAGHCHGFTVLGVAVNNPPAVGIVAPVEPLATVTNTVGNVTNVVSFNLPRTNTTCVVLPVSAVASDLGGAVARVRLYVNGVQLADGAGAQLDRRWTNGVPGLFVLTAVAVDNRGAVGISAPVRVVYVPPPVRTLVPLALVNGRLELCLGGEDGKEYDVETSVDLITWTRVARFGGAFPVWEYQDPGLVSEPQRFFRAVEVVP